MGYESLHIMKSHSVQCLQVDDVIPILSPAVYCGFCRCGSQRFCLVALLLDGCIKSIQVVVFSKAAAFYTIPISLIS